MLKGRGRKQNELCVLGGGGVGRSDGCGLRREVSLLVPPAPAELCVHVTSSLPRLNYRMDTQRGNFIMSYRCLHWMEREGGRK